MRFTECMSLEPVSFWKLLNGCSLHEWTEGKAGSQHLESDVLMCPIMPDKEGFLLFTSEDNAIFQRLSKHLYGHWMILFCFETCGKPHKGSQESLLLRVLIHRGFLH